MDVPIQARPETKPLEENIGAVALELTPDDLREIDSAASKSRWRCSVSGTPGKI